LVGLVSVSTQTPPQQTRPLGQTPPQRPQLALSVCGFTQAPPQQIWAVEVQFTQAAAFVPQAVSVPGLMQVPFRQQPLGQVWAAQPRQIWSTQL